MTKTVACLSWGSSPDHSDVYICLKCVHAFTKLYLLAEVFACTCILHNILEKQLSRIVSNASSVGLNFEVCLIAW